MTSLIYHNLSTDGGGLITSLPKEVVIPRSSEELSDLIGRCHKERRPITVRGGGKTTEGESLAAGEEILVHLRGLNKFISIDDDEGQKTIWVEGGISIQEVDSLLAQNNLSFISAPLNLSATIGGTLGVGGIDVTSAFEGCLADQVIELEVVLPNGDIKRCSHFENSDLFEDVLYGYGQFGIVSRVRLPVKTRVPVKLEFLYYTHLEKAIDDLVEMGMSRMCDQLAILSLRSDVIALIIGFETDEKHEKFQQRRKGFSGKSEVGLWGSKVWSVLSDPLLVARTPFLFRARSEILKSLQDPLYQSEGKCLNRLACFGKLIWKFWGAKPIVIPDVSVSLNKLKQVALEGNEICQKNFSRYTLYIVLVKKKVSADRYTLGPFPETEDELVGGVEFEPLLENTIWTPDGLQQFKEDIYNLGHRHNGRAYRFGGLMKNHIKAFCGDEEWQKFVNKKEKWDPNNILNSRVLR